MKLEILGTGCPKCESLTEIVSGTVAELGIQAEIVKVKDIKEILKFKVMMTPALVIDGVVKSSGRIPTKAELANWLTTKSV